jgi:ribosomal protection tetracycline resistance protein
MTTAVADGVRAGLAEGLGYEIVHAKVVFARMQYSSVSSTPADFRRLAPLVLKKALALAGLIRMEPWVVFSATVPPDAQKKLLLLIGKRRATVSSVAYDQSACTARGEAPLNDMKDFVAEVAMLSRGDGVADVKFLEYRKVQ